MINPLFELERAICASQQRFAIAHLRFNPRPEDERMEELRQEYEAILGLLESEFLGALISGDWSEFDQFVNDFKTQCTSTPTTITEAVDDDHNLSAATRDAIAYSTNH